MKQLLQMINHYKGKLQTLFFCSVLVLVILELLRLKDSLSWTDVQSVLLNIAPSRLFLIFLIGLLAVVPMLAYDWILNKKLDNHFSKTYLFETSWAINTINNLAGFAGLVDFGLRYSFYAKDEGGEQSVQKITAIIPYFMSGLSLFSALLLLLNLLFPQGEQFEQYNWLLLAVSLYSPILIFLSSRKNLPFIGKLDRKTILSLLTSSFLDWAAVSTCFILIGYLLGFKVNPLTTLALFILALVLGMLSMIPGGLGSFDLVMLTGLTSLGYNNSDVLAWILVFRLVYYIIPFILGLMFFTHQTGGRLNQTFQGIPKNLGTNFLQMSQVFFIRLFGVFLVLSALIPEQLASVHWLSKFNPIHAQLIWQFPSVLLGLSFILLARAVKSELRSSFGLALALFLISLIYVNLGTFSLFTSLFILLELAMMVAIRHRLTKSSFLYAWEDRSRDTVIIGMTLLLLLTLGHERLFRPDFHFHSIHLQHYLLFFGHLFLATSLIGLTFLTILNHLRKDRVVLGDNFEANRYTNLLNQYGGDSDSGLAYLKDKRLYWYQEDGKDKVVFQFALENNKAVVMGEPIGQTEKFGQALGRFIKTAKEANYQVIFYEIGQQTTLLLHNHGYEFMKFGESATVELKSFSLEGKKGKKFRTIINKLEKQGFTFEISPAPHSQELLDQLKKISDHWLAGRQEKGFSLGFFDRGYLQLSPLALVRNPQQDIIAFANFMPGLTDQLATIDLMRYNRDLSPNGIMDYLFANLLSYFKEEGKDNFDLGMAPLSQVGNLEDSFLQERLAYLVYSFSSRFYSFDGLRRYKEKFSPTWTAKYLAYPKKTWLLYDMIAVFKIDNKAIKTYGAVSHDDKKTSIGNRKMSITKVSHSQKSRTL